MEKKLVLRTCVVSREVCEKKDLIRVVRTPEHNVIIDLKGKANGRGAYLKKDKETLQIKKQSIQKGLAFLQSDEYLSIPTINKL